MYLLIALSVVDYFQIGWHNTRKLGILLLRKLRRLARWDATEEENLNSHRIRVTKRRMSLRTEWWLTKKS